MRLNPRALMPLALVLIASGPLRADVLGRIAGKVTNKAGLPIAGAVVTMKRLDISWTKELKVDSKGAFFQVGLDPKEYEMVVTAPGHQTYKETIKIPVGDALTKNLTLQTEEEANASAKAVAAATLTIADPSAAAEDDATEAFNTAVGFYQTKSFPQALAPSEKAYKGFQTAMTKAKDDAGKQAIEPKFQKASMLYGMILSNTEKKEEAFEILSRYSEKNGKDVPVLNVLIKLSKEKKDKASEAKFLAMLEEVEGPKPELAYNEAVVAFNAGKNKEARTAIEKALKVDSKFAESYYLLGMIEFGDNHLPAAKAAFRKYLEIAPNGKKAGEVKEFLKELK